VTATICWKAAGASISELFRDGPRALVRYAEESAKPDNQRLREIYRRQFPGDEAGPCCRAPRSIPNSRRPRCAFGMTMVQRLLGPDRADGQDDLRRQVPGPTWRRNWSTRGGLKDLGVRKEAARWRGRGDQRVEGPDDPVSPSWSTATPRAVRKDFEDTVDAPVGQEFRPAWPRPGSSSTAPRSTRTRPSRCGLSYGFGQGL